LSVLAVRGHLLLKHPLPEQTQVLAPLSQSVVAAAANKAEQAGTVVLVAVAVVTYQVVVVQQAKEITAAVGQQIPQAAAVVAQVVRVARLRLVLDWLVQYLEQALPTRQAGLEEPLVAATVWPVQRTQETAQKAHSKVLVPLAQTAAPALSSFATSAHSAEQAGQSLLLAATPFTPSLHLERTQHEPLCKSQQRHRRAGHRCRA
jgi:hypothetical protein